MANRDLLKGVVLGAAAVALVPVIMKAFGISSKPLGHAALRTAQLLSEKVREAASELGEIAEDTFAEMQVAAGSAEQDSEPVTERAPEGDAASPVPAADSAEARTA
jgi:hypothetical protein